METRDITKASTHPLFFFKAFNKLFWVGRDGFLFQTDQSRGLALKKSIRLMDEIYCSRK